jgi:hypothetical protein
MRPHFRFEDLEIWQIAKRLAIKLHHLAHQLEDTRSNCELRGCL